MTEKGKTEVIAGGNSIAGMIHSPKKSELSQQELPLDELSQPMLAWRFPEEVGARAIGDRQSLVDPKFRQAFDQGSVGAAQKSFGVTQMMLGKDAHGSLQGWPLTAGDTAIVGDSGRDRKVGHAEGRMPRAEKAERAPTEPITDDAV